MSKEKNEPLAVTRRIYVGNLGTNVTADDLFQLFGLRTTEYLKKTCSVELVAWKNNEVAKNYAFINVPEDVYGELVKLNGIEFYGRQLAVEEAKTKVSTIEKEEKKTESKENMEKQGTVKEAGVSIRGAARGRGRGIGRGLGRGRGGRGRGRGGIIYMGRRWGGPPRSRFNIPKLDPDQVFHVIDCGVNFTNPKFLGNTDQAVARALSAGVQKMVVTGLKLVGSKCAVIMSKSHPSVLYAAVGVHPHFAKEDWNDKTADHLEELVKLPEVIAIGECGLDFNRNFSPAELQMSTFKQQVQLAIRYQKPLLIHERDSHEEILNVLKEFESTLPSVVIHCFTGTADQIKTYVSKGFYIGVTGFVCKEKHGAHLRDAIKDGTLPLNRIILQTNAPYMIPNTPREEMDPVSQTLLDHCYVDNEPCTLPIIVRCIAKCLTIEPKHVSDQCTDTAMTVFRFHKSGNNFEC